MIISMVCGNVKRRGLSKSALFATKPEVPWPYIAVKPAQIPRAMARSQSVKRRREANRYK
ncbi:Uncharacterised protein [Vibrio cholerae]|uniref:Uncharacterized protein n=1 Tax=Vibrio cholerae TaxID=666 RepID=A0A655Y7E4_VIBCL|nr:Uncharacterised protein [Vibrio cholerae]